MKVYLTKYCLTDGIQQIEGEMSNDGNIFITPRIGNTYPQYFHKDDWFFTKEEAISNAEERRIKKLKSLDKQIKKISELNF